MLEVERTGQRGRTATKPSQAPLQKHSPGGCAISLHLAEYLVTTAIMPVWCGGNVVGRINKVVYSVVQKTGPLLYFQITSTSIGQYLQFLIQKI